MVTCVKTNELKWFWTLALFFSILTRQKKKTKLCSLFSGQKSIKDIYLHFLFVSFPNLVHTWISQKLYISTALKARRMTYKLKIKLWDLVLFRALLSVTWLLREYNFFQRFWHQYIVISPVNNLPPSRGARQPNKFSSSHKKCTRKWVAPLLGRTF